MTEIELFQRHERPERVHQPTCKRESRSPTYNPFKASRPQGRKGRKEGSECVSCWLSKVPPMGICIGLHTSEEISVEKDGSDLALLRVDGDSVQSLGGEVDGYSRRLRQSSRSKGIHGWTSAWGS